MSCPSYLVSLAQQIWNDLGQPPAQPVSYIQSKLVSPSYVGQLNNLAATCLVSVSGSISPELNEAQQGIYRAMYEKDYYTTMLNQTLAGLDPGFVELREGDSVIRVANPIEKAKVYREMQKQLNEQLTMQVSAYRMGESLPTSVNFPTIVNSWNAGYGYINGGPPAAGGAHNYYRS